MALSLHNPRTEDALEERGGRVRVGLLSDNEAGLALLERDGLRPIWSAPRMVLGEPLDWRPDWIWGQLNHAIG